MQAAAPLPGIAPLTEQNALTELLPPGVAPSVDLADGAGHVSLHERTMPRSLSNLSVNELVISFRAKRVCEASTDLDDFESAKDDEGDCEPP
jgi:hypothetical protein